MSSSFLSSRTNQFTKQFFNLNNNNSIITTMAYLNFDLIQGIPVTMIVTNEKKETIEHNYDSSDLQQIVVNLKRTYSGQVIDATIIQMGLNFGFISISC
jgi:hypothetical protein